MTIRLVLSLLIVGAGLILARHNKYCAFSVLLLWIVAVIYLAFLSREPTYTPTPILDPLRAIKRFWQFRDAPGTWKYQYLEGIAMNILLFVPLGYCLPVLFSRWHSCRKVVLLGFMISLLIETMQIVTCFGSFDVADLINNTAGTWAGCALYKAIMKQ